MVAGFSCVGVVATQLDFSFNYDDLLSTCCTFKVSKRKEKKIIVRATKNADLL